MRRPPDPPPHPGATPRPRSRRAPRGPLTTAKLVCIGPAGRAPHAHRRAPRAALPPGPLSPPPSARPRASLGAPGPCLGGGAGRVAKMWARARRSPHRGAAPAISLLHSLVVCRTAPAAARPRRRGFRTCIRRGRPRARARAPRRPRRSPGPREA
ncbi:MAG: hypothetical protein J3K34DRAFT_220788 [Monoraphidium minutum]|nr:MAG: hypothetical protein J3K34DRAFT_220788 [Monoraphidium minutum]